jgi:hypothetical protein
MSLPATWFALPHVGTTGNQGSHLAACADPQVCGLFRRRQLEHRPVRTHDVRDLQRRDLSGLPEATTAPTNTRTAHDPHTRQCSLPSRDTPCPVPTPARPTPASPVPATVQPATCADRARMETDTAPRDPQPLLRHASRRAQSRQCLLRSLASTEQRVAPTMLHYLRRCV